MKIRLVLGLMVFLVACGPSEEDLQMTVESRVQIYVSQTVEAIPTQTPYPTLTPLPEPTENPIPDVFKNQLNEFLRAANAVTGATSQGVTNIELRRLVNEARGAYDFAIAMWPENVANDSQTDFEEAFEGWDLTLYLWVLDIEDADEPVEPDINRYQDYVSYSDLLVLETHPDTFIVRDYRGKQYVSFDNIEILLAIAAAHFDSGQMKVLSLLE